MATNQQLYLVPAKGVRVRDPATGQALPAEGAYKPRIAYWFRRLRDGDVTEGKAPAPQAAAPAPAATSTSSKKGDAQ